MQSNQQSEQITKTVVGVTTVFVAGIALLSSVFVVPAGEVGVAVSYTHLTLPTICSV